MTITQMSLSHKLLQRIRMREYPVGLTDRDIQAIPITSSLLDDILECLSSPEPGDQKLAQFFVSALLPLGTFDPKREVILCNLIESLCRSHDTQIRASSYQLLTSYRAHFPRFRAMMIEGLLDSHSEVRREALSSFPYYGKQQDLHLLEAFEKDPFHGEIAMGGPHEYELRNFALEAIERTIKKTFRKSENSEILSTGEIAYWWDWSPYHRWKNSWLSKFRKP